MEWRLQVLAAAALLLPAGRIVRAESPAAPAAPITIDAGKTGEPISEYIYGQFIEHLGRCIYGGIWAEMLEDRKFFYPVGAKESPWKAIGAGEFEMNREEPLVGQHSPQVTPANCGAEAGLAQSGLALRKGKKYVGRIWLAPPPKLGTPPVTVSLVWGQEPKERQTLEFAIDSPDFAKHELEFTAASDTDDGRLEIMGRSHYRVGAVSLMPADNIDGMRRDTLALLAELDSPVYRWPGGNFVSGYNWKDGVGDRDRRPPRKNPAWKGIEPNDFGLDEFMVFCRCLKTEPYIAVNSGLGDARMAAEEVEYANGAADTPMGRLRAANGHPEPYRVKFWGVGNEMYGGWQLGHMPLDQYAKKHNEFAEAMRKVDPSIKLVAVGEAGKWSQAMLADCADHMDLISEHFYCHDKKDLDKHVRQIPDSIRRKVEAHRGYRREIDALKGKDIRIAMDEWNYWYGRDEYGELGTRYFLKDALGIAAGLNEYARQSDMVFMADYAQAVNVLGCIKTSKTDAAFETTGLALKLYRRHFGVLPVAATAVPPLDVAAAWTVDRKTLTVAIVNPTMDEVVLPLKVAGARLSGGGRRWQIAGDPMAYNEPGKAPKVAIEETAPGDARTELWVAPCSITLYALGAEIL